MTAFQRNVTQVPEMIKKLLLSHQDPGVVQIYECQNSDDFLSLAEKFPLETNSLANKSGTTIIGYYMVGIALPIKSDTFTRPILVYYYLTDADWRIWHDEIRAEAEKRKKVYMENKNSFRDIKNSR